MRGLGGVGRDRVLQRYGDVHTRRGVLLPGECGGLLQDSDELHAPLGGTDPRWRSVSGAVSVKSPKPKYWIGQLVKIAVSRPLIGMAQGDQVAITEIAKTHYGFRYKVIHLSGRVGWMDEDWLCDPLFQ